MVGDSVVGALVGEVVEPVGHVSHVTRQSLITFLWIPHLAFWLAHVLSLPFMRTTFASTHTALVVVIMVERKEVHSMMVRNENMVVVGMILVLVERKRRKV